MDDSEKETIENRENVIVEIRAIETMEARHKETIEGRDKETMEDSENCCEVIVSNLNRAVIADVEPAIQQKPSSQSEGHDSAKTFNKDDVESSPPVNIQIPEVVLDEATGLLRRALLAVTKEKELDGGKSVVSSIDGETMQIQSDTTSITMSLAGGAHEEMELGGVSDPPTEPETATMMNIKGLKIAELLHKDQLDGFNSLADTHIVCEDGHVPCHRYILMAASKFINELLITEDPSELAVIHIPDVKVINVVQVLCILYSGKALYTKSDERDIYKIFRMLGISTDGLQFRNSKPEDGDILGRLRFYGTEEAEEEEFIPNIIDQELADPERSSPSLDNTSTTESIHKDVAQDGLIENRGPKVSSRSQIDKAETAKFLSIKMEMPEDEDAIVETEFKIKCRYCEETFTSERILSRHLSSLCGSHLVGKYSYSNKQCLGCRRRFPSFSLYGLINHVESCKRLQVAFSATASQFVNGTLPPISVKEEGVVNDEEVNDDECQAPSRKIPKRQDPPKSSRKKQKKGVKKRKNPTRSTTKAAGSSACSSSSVTPAIKIVDVSSLVDDRSNSEQESDKATDPEVILIDDDSNDNVAEGQKGEASGTNGYHQNISEDDECEYVIENNETFRDIASVPMQDLQLLLSSCPVCRKRYAKLKTASKCLRTHGLRRCWICLKLLAANGQGFYQHNKKYHMIPGTDNKVECSFCKKQFGYNIGLNTHMGNFHFARLLETTTKDFAGGNVEPLTATQMKTLNTLNRGVGENDSEGYPVGAAGDKLAEQGLDESNDSDVMEVDDNSSDIQEIPQQSSSFFSSTATASHSAGSPPVLQQQRAQPNLGRVLLEIKEINGVIYNVYGLINPTSTGPKTKFSKVIAIRNTDVDS